MKRVIGIGGIFFKAKDPKALAEWYEKHLGIDFGGKFYADFQFQEKEKGWTAFSFFDADTNYFTPSEKEFMINLRVENLDELLKFYATKAFMSSMSAKTAITANSAGFSTRKATKSNCGSRWNRSLTIKI